MLGQLGVFAAVLAFFHLSEFALAVNYMRDQLSTKCKCRQAQGPLHLQARHSHLNSLHAPMSWQDRLVHP
jgi:hypothetical protein